MLEVDEQLYISSFVRSFGVISPGELRIKVLSSQELLSMGHKAPYLSRRCAFANRDSLAESWEVRGTCAHQLCGLCLRGMSDIGRLISLNLSCSPCHAAHKNTNNSLSRSRYASSQVRSHSPGEHEGSAVQARSVNHRAYPVGSGCG